MAKKKSNPKTSDGLVVVASVSFGAEEEKSPPPSTDEVAAVPQTKKQVRYKCGHDYAAKFDLNFFGEKYGLADQVFVEREECGDCMIAAMKPALIRCGECGYAICPGDGVALYGNDESFEDKPWKQTVDNGESVMGCMRAACCPSGGFFAGNWDGKKFVPRFEGGTAAGEAARTGETVVANAK